MPRSVSWWWNGIFCRKPSIAEPGSEEDDDRPRSSTALDCAPVTIDRPNQVWCADVTYIPTRRGFLYLVAVVDWFSRKVLAWRLSNTMDADFCVAALAEAMVCFGRPEIFKVVSRIFRKFDQATASVGVPKLCCITPIDPTWSSAAGRPTRSMLRRQTRRNWRRNPT